MYRIFLVEDDSVIAGEMESISGWELVISESLSSPAR